MTIDVKAAASYTGARRAAGRWAMFRWRRRHLPGLLLATLLAGCAAPPPQASVQVFTLPVQLPPGTTYRHERLPLQAMRPDQAVLDGVADAALGRAGLRRDDANARFTFLVTVGQDAVAYGSGWGPASVGVGVGGGSWGGGGVGIGLSFPIGGTTVYPAQKVDAVLRDQATGQVVFQAQVRGNPGVNPAALLEAALRDFPNGPAGVRVVPLAGAAGY